MFKKSLLFMLLMTLLAPWVANAQETLTVYDGTETNNYVPFYGLYADDGVKCEFVIPADELEGMANGTISAMKFYLKSVGYTTITPSITVFVKEVEFTTLTALTGTTDATTVFNSSITFTGSTSDVEINIPFSSDYSYGGGNLLIGFYQDAALGTGNYSSTSWYGVTQTTNTAWSGSGSGSARKFLPKTTFTYEPAPQSDCPNPTDLHTGNLTAHSVTIGWNNGSGTFDVEFKKTSESTWTSRATNYQGWGISLVDLDDNTNYKARVRSVCTDETSGWETIDFTTPVGCPEVPTNLTVTLDPNDATVATLNWDAEDALSWQVCVNNDMENLIMVDNNPTYQLTGLTSGTNYTVKVRTYCNAVDQSAWISQEFTTACVTINSFPWTQDFEGYEGNASGITFDDPCWQNLHIEGSGTYFFEVYYSESGQGGNTTKMLRLHDMANGTKTKLRLPEMSIPTGTAYQFSIDVYRNSSYSGKTDEGIRVFASADGEIDDATELAFIPRVNTVENEVIPAEEEAGWYTYELDIPMTGTCYIVLRGESQYGTATYMDNFKVKEKPSCMKPTNVAVNYTGGTTATVSFNSDATAWNLDVNGTVTAINTNPYTIEGLELTTTYNVKVQANCGGSTSEWTNAVSFTTDMCMPENQCQLTFVLHDSYGDGWNGNAIKVVDVLTSTVLATMEADSHGGGGVASTDTKYLSVCDGRAIQFSWVSGSYADETSYEVYDVNGDEIFSGSGAMSDPVNYTVSCTVTTCKKPTDLAASEISGHSVKLSWTENGEATAWVVAYTLYEETKFTEVEANAKPYVLAGLSPETHYKVKVKPVCEVEKWSDEIDFTTDVACSAPNNLAVSDIQPYQATVSWTGEASEYNLRYRELTAADFATITFAPNDVWQDGTGYQLLLDADATAYGTIIPEEGGLTTSGNASAAVYAEFEYKIPVNADGAMNTQNVLIGESATIQVPAGTYDWCVPNPTPGDRIWIAGEGRADDYVIEAGNTYLFVVQSNGDGGDEVVVTITSAKKGEPKADWKSIEGITSPYTLTTLQPETNYTVEVQSDCGGDGTSAWTSTNFSTPSNCGVPTPLDVTELEAHSATLNWTGVQENYQVQYRTAGSRELLFFEDFDGQPSTWTLTNSSYGRTSSATTDYLVFMGQGSTEAAYLITPDLTGIVSKGTVEFNQRVYNGTATFKVGFSSTTNDVEAFDWGSEVSAAPTMFTAYSVAMPAGTKYVAITTTTAESDCAVLINDFGIYGNEIPAGEWNTATVNNATTYAISSGLKAETKYEWQVRGVNSSCTGGYTEWSELRNFTTPASCLVPTNLTVSNVTASTAELAWESTASVFDIDVDGTLIENVTDNPYTLTGLTPETIYTVAVRANCGDGDYSDWTSEVSFLTGCGGAKTVPYTYGFEDYNDMACWTTSSANTVNNMGIMNAAANSVDAYEGDYVFLFSSYNSASAYDQYLISPELDGGTDPICAGFYYRSVNGNGTGETFAVGYSTTTDDFDAFTWGDEISTTTTEWTQFSAIFPAGTKYVAVHYYANYQYYLIIDAFSFTKPEEITWNVGEDWPSHTVPPAGDNVTIPDNTVVIIPAGCVANAGDITLPASSIIIIEDGGQLIHTNAVNATVEKNVAAYTAKDSDGWYLIATPVSSTETSVVAQGTYDLYKYNEPTAYWHSDTGTLGAFSTMNRNTGYLYANAADIDLNFAGETQATNTEVSVDLSYTATLSTDVRGFNLVGNPFTCNVEEGDMKLGDETNLAYLTMNDTHTDFVTVNISDRPIKPGEAFFVQATAEGQSLEFNPTTAKSSNNGYIRIVAGNENGSDNAYINLANGNTIRKFNIANGTKVYVINEGQDFAAARVEELEGKIPVNFKAVADGEYTITINANNVEAHSMYLRDNFSGETIDLLENPSYTFKATTNDEDNRFKLIFDCNNYTGIDENFTGDIFAYQYGNEIIVNGEGTLEVFDVMGRMVLNTKVNGVQKVNVPANNVYIFKLMGETVKTQKIVVR